MLVDYEGWGLNGFPGGCAGQVVIGIEYLENVIHRDLIFDHIGRGQSSKS